MLVLLVVFPLAMAGVAFALPSGRWRPCVLPVAGLCQLLLVLRALVSAPEHPDGYWLVLDPLGRVFLLEVTVLFLFCSVYAPGYLRLRPERPNQILCASMLFSLSMMTLVILSHHMGLMWVAMEATTLASAPSIYFNHNSRSLNATWKYLLLCSVGIALALLGTFFIAYSALHGGLVPTLFFDDLLALAPKLSRPWLHAAFVFLLVGYGTKMGLAPMHAWKPDAYGEAPGMIGALMAGGLTNCAFLAILRFHQVCVAAGDADYARQQMIFLGLLSMAVAAVCMARQRDFKKLLAFSSVEHMGILVLGIGIGGEAVFGALLHVINNGLTKGVLFLSAGNIHRVYASKSVADVQGALRRVPMSAALFLLGFIAITGSPPFGPFLSEFTIVSAAVLRGNHVAATLFLVFLFLAFTGFGGVVLPMILGRPSAKAGATAIRDSFLTVAPIVILMLLVLGLGIHVPAPLENLLREGAAFLDGAGGVANAVVAARGP